MDSTQTTLHQLLALGQSPWIDNITRGMLQSGELQRLIDQGVVGLTSNPTIFQKAIGAGNDYDEALQKLVREGKGIDEIYDALVLDDIRNAAGILRQVYDRTDGADGFVSIEVSPELAHNTEGTIADARRFFSFLNAPNIMIKVPGTAEGIPAFRQIISEGINVNVTLLFSVENYRAIAEAYVDGLEALDRSGKPIGGVASVASFFVSRVDSAIDAALEQKIKDDPAKADEYLALLGKAAIVNAKIAYEDVYKQVFSTPRWQALEAKGAKRQRPLWASTSTKNPAYRDVLYVEELIGKDTVNTMPPATIVDFLDHGRVRQSLEEDVAGARETISRLEAAGVQLSAVTDKLQTDGVSSFAKSFHDLIETITQKRLELLAHAG